MHSDYTGIGPDSNLLRVVRKWQVRELVSDLLTNVDATYSDPVQREAQKQIIKSTVYRWFDVACNDMPELNQDVQEFLNQRQEAWDKAHSAPSSEPSNS